jgi:mRNA interferase YafQ
LAKRKPKPKAETEAPEPPPPLILETTSEFERGLKRMEKRGKRLEKLHAVIELLQTHQALPRSQKDHALAGDRKGWRDCHVEPDWVLIYKKEGDTLILGETGTHSDLFGK